MDAVKKLPKSEVEITLTIEGKNLAEEYERQYQKMAPSVTIKGFRPGKAPRNMIEDTLSRGKIYEEAMNDLIFEAYRKVVIENKLDPISYPEFKIDKLEEGKDVKVIAKVALRPEAKLGNYKKIRAKKKELKETTDKDVKELIETSFESWKAQQEALAKSQTETKIETATNISEAKVKSEDTTQKKDDFIDISKLGKNSFEDFLKANQVQNREELDKKVKETLTEQKKLSNEKEWVKELFEKLVKMTEIEIPEILIEQELTEMEKNLEAQFKPLGLSLDDYLKHQKKSREGLKKEWREQAEQNIKLEFSLSALAKAEEIFVKDDEIKTVIDSVQDPNIRKELEKPEQKVYIKYQLQREKTVEKLKEISESK